MGEKSHVSMEQHACKVCGQVFDTGAILLDRRLGETLEARTVTGMGMCPSCDGLREDGYIALIGCDPERTSVNAWGGVKPGDAYRTGSIAHMRKEAAAKVFGEQMVEDHVFLFVDEEVIDMLKASEGEQV